VDRTVASSADFTHQLRAFDAFEALQSSVAGPENKAPTHIESTLKAASNDANLVPSAEHDKARTQ
jgi:hypothetical protein